MEFQSNSDQQIYFFNFNTKSGLKLKDCCIFEPVIIVTCKKNGRRLLQPEIRPNLIIQRDHVVNQCMAGLDVRAYNRYNGWVVVLAEAARIYTIQCVTMLELMLQYSTIL